VRAAMYDAMRFWLRRGADGFRVDVIYHLIKDEFLRDNPPNPDFIPGGDPAHRLLPQHTTDQPEVQMIVMEMRQVLDEFSGPTSSRVLIGEVYLPIDRLMNYYGLDAAGVLRGAQLPFNFHLIGAQWQATMVDRLVREYEAALPPGAAPNWVLGNHDKPRIATRVGVDGARLAAMLLLTLRGTPTLYYGDELGMTDVQIPKDEVQDPFERNEPGKSLGRDPQRTPMAWSAEEPHAGFTNGRPWLRLGADWRDRNVARQLGEEGSMLQLYRRLLALRRQHAALNEGAYEPIAVQGNVLVYARDHEGARVVVLLNFGHQPVTVSTSHLFLHASPPPAVWLSTFLDRQGRVADEIELRPDEGLIVGNGLGIEWR
jgi:alpha-glucosidase